MKYSLSIFFICGLLISCTKPKTDGSATFSSTCNSSPEPFSTKPIEEQVGPLAEAGRESWLGKQSGGLPDLDPLLRAGRARKYADQVLKQKFASDSDEPQANDSARANDGTSANDSDNDSDNDSASDNDSDNDSAINIKKSQKLVALIDHACIAQSSPSALLLSILAQNPHAGVVEVEALEFKIDRDHAKDEFEARIQAEPCVLQVNFPKRIYAMATFNDPRAVYQKHLESLKFFPAYSKFFEQSISIQSDVIVAVVDTGVKYTHEDLAANMWDDGNGHVGIDFVDLDDDPMDTQGHGTHVAGLVAAGANNSKGGIGIMAGRVKIMAVRVLSDYGTVATVVNGINYAVEHGAHVINLSLGVEGSDNLILAALRNAVANGVVVTTAAGNERSEISAKRMFIPAAYARDIEGVISVTSHDTSSTALSGFSNFSSNYVEISAPGAEDSKKLQAMGGIYSTSSDNGNVGYVRLMGTSMSSPIAAGAAALTIGLLKAYGKTPTPAQVEYLIKASALRYNSLWSKVQNGRALDLDRLADFVAAYGSGQSFPTTSACQ